ncbi:lipid IV(A) 3-deoxy-D-manno-octulosonic acid transferase [Orbaceae bacterium ac157xtp]
MQLLYTCLLYLIQPFVWLRLLLRSRKAPAYRKRWSERYGFCKNKVIPNGILVHSVSVGETIASIPLIKELQIRYPDLPITVTTMTPTGSAQVKKSLGDSVSHVYLPYDLPCAINRFLNHVRPKLVIIMETELWPNFISVLHNRKIPLIIANARLSARSAKGYARLGKSIRTLLKKIPMIAVQNKVDGDRFIALGLPPKQLTITGSIKFDIDLSDEQKQQITQLKTQWQLNRPVWVVASTHQGEDEIILSAYQKLLHIHPNLLLILVPRHPERFKEVEQLIKQRHLNYQLRSQNLIPNEQTQVILGDTMGELMVLYSVADVVFIGGSLVNHGGHNPLEPALHHKAIITGEHIFNFKVICEQLEHAHGLKIIKNSADDLFHNVNELLTNRAMREQQGENAFTVLKQNQGALNRLLALIDQFIQAS